MNVLIYYFHLSFPCFSHFLTFIFFFYLFSPYYLLPGAHGHHVIKCQGQEQEPLQLQVNQ